MGSKMDIRKERYDVELPVQKTIKILSESPYLAFRSLLIVAFFIFLFFTRPLHLTAFKCIVNRYAIVEAKLNRAQFPHLLFL